MEERVLIGNFYEELNNIHRSVNEPILAFSRLEDHIEDELSRVYERFRSTIQTIIPEAASQQTLHQLTNVSIKAGRLYSYAGYKQQITARNKDLRAQIDALTEQYGTEEEITLKIEEIEASKDASYDAIDNIEQHLRFLNQTATYIERHNTRFPKHEITEATAADFFAKPKLWPLKSFLASRAKGFQNAKTILANYKNSTGKDFFTDLRTKEAYEETKAGNQADIYEIDTQIEPLRQAQQRFGELRRQITPAKEIEQHLRKKLHEEIDENPNFLEALAKEGFAQEALSLAIYKAQISALETLHEKAMDFDEAAERSDNEIESALDVMEGRVRDISMRAIDVDYAPITDGVARLITNLDENLDVVKSFFKQIKGFSRSKSFSDLRARNAEIEDSLSALSHTIITPDFELDEEVYGVRKSIRNYEEEQRRIREERERIRREKERLRQIAEAARRKRLREERARQRKLASSYSSSSGWRKPSNSSGWSKPSRSRSSSSGFSRSSRSRSSGGFSKPSRRR